MSIVPLQALFGKGMGWSSFFEKRVHKRSRWTVGTLLMATSKVLCTTQELHRSVQDSAMVSPAERLWREGGNQGQNILIPVPWFSHATTCWVQCWVVGRWLCVRGGLYPPRGNILGWHSLRSTCVWITAVKWRFPSFCQNQGFWKQMTEDLHFQQAPRWSFWILRPEKLRAGSVGENDHK